MQLERAAPPWAALSVVCAITYPPPYSLDLIIPGILRDAAMQIMRLLFASSDIAAIGHVSRDFVAAGIPYGVRYDPPREGFCPTPPHAELWVQNETDFHRAVMIYLNRATQSPSPNPQSQVTIL